MKSANAIEKSDREFGENLLGIDIGGTFTDVACYNISTRSWIYRKVLTTYPDLEVGVSEAVQIIDIDLKKTRRLVHGTTVVTNTVIEGKGSKIGLVATRGFADVLEVARSDKAEPHGHLQDKFGPGRPRHLVPRHLCLEVDERVAFDGSVIRPLDKKSVSEAILRFKKEGVEVIAVSLINSYANPIHESSIREVFRREYPEASVHLSTEISRIVREYERTSTTVVNAYVSKMTERYLANLISRLRSHGYPDNDISVMTSAGGVVNSEAATARPVLLVESGPAAGVIAARDLGARARIRNIISFDMGGTTAKAALIDAGSFSFSTQYKVAALAGHTIGKGSQGGGYPINIVVIDIAEAGAGGGSIAWIDSGSALNVGPQSATSHPGPACYGFGGVDPTVTDANLVLGRINPSSLAGGYLKVRRDLALKAIHDKIARPLDLEDIDAALGIVEIVNANMNRVIRIVSLEKGYDPRDYTMVAFGSAAPQHAAFLADELQIPSVVVPRDPGCFSAKGLVIAQPQEDIVQTYVSSVDNVDPRSLADTVNLMRDSLSRRSGNGSGVSMRLSFEMRYPKQGWEINVRAKLPRIDKNTPVELAKEFARIHQQMYGYHFEKIAPLIVSIRLSLIQRAPKIELEKMPYVGVRPPTEALTGHREVLFARGVGGMETAVYDRSKLRSGNVMQGPALIEESQSTTVIPPSHKCSIDKIGNLVITSRRKV